MSYDSTGAGKHPKLGRGKPVGLATPGGAQKLPASSTDVPELARPGKPGGQIRVKAAGIPPAAARPGKKGSIGGGAGKPSKSPDW